jgi:hypothetical protein
MKKNKKKILRKIVWGIAIFAAVFALLFYFTLVLYTMDYVNEFDVKIVNDKLRIDFLYKSKNPLGIFNGRELCHYKIESFTIVLTGSNESTDISELLSNDICNSALDYFFAQNSHDYIGGESLFEYGKNRADFLNCITKDTTSLAYLYDRFYKTEKSFTLLTDLKHNYSICGAPIGTYGNIKTFIYLVNETAYFCEPPGYPDRVEFKTNNVDLNEYDNISVCMKLSNGRKIESCRAIKNIKRIISSDNTD